jgi:hypothetical protein
MALIGNQMEIDEVPFLAGRLRVSTVITGRPNEFSAVFDGLEWFFGRAA